MTSEFREGRLRELYLQRGIVQGKTSNREYLLSLSRYKKYGYKERKEVVIAKFSNNNSNAN